MNVPKIRFKGFVDKWELKELSDLVTYIKGFAFKSVDYQKEGYRIIRVSDLLEEIINGNNEKIFIDKEKSCNYEKYRIHRGEIIVTTVGSKPEVTKSAVGRTIYYNSLDIEFLNQNLIKLSSSNHINSYFIYQNTKTNRYRNHIENIQRGNANQSNITVKELLEYTIYTPAKNEQSKIADFFRILDKKFQLQQEKIDLLKEQKKGYMQKIFNQELRFKDSNGSDFQKWLNKVKAESLFESVSNKNHNGDYPVLSATQDNGMVLRDSLERHMAFNDDNLKSYKLVEKNDFIISLRSFQGGIEFSNLQGLVSPAYTVFKSKSELVYDLYFAKVFKTEDFISRLNSTTYGIRDGKAISYKDFSSLRFNIPSIEEQKKIAEFLDLLDLKILNENKKLEQLLNQKQAFMQQMFI